MADADLEANTVVDQDTEIGVDLDSSTLERGRLRKAFRLGVVRGASGQFKAMASVGLAVDGGVFVAPAQVRSYDWQYGIVRPGESPREGEYFGTRERPKLHYHKSGIASITLTGTDLPPCSLRLPSLRSADRSQILSVVSTRLWEFGSKEPRLGDVFSLERRWPESVGFTMAIVSLSSREARQVVFRDDFPIGLVRGDARRWAVDLCPYGWEALLIGSIQVSYNATAAIEPGTTVSAFKWSPDGPEEVSESLALWTSSMRNPVISYDREEDLVDPATLRERGLGTFTLATVAEQIERGNISGA